MSEPTVEERAREMGWTPKESFRGAPENFVDAETFVRRGEELMPILKANNRRLSEKVSHLETQLSTTQQTLQASAEAIEELKTFNSQVALEKAKEKRKELLTGLTQAKKDGDVEAEVELADQLATHTAAIREAEKKGETIIKEDESRGPPAKDWTQEPGWKSWLSENSWFGQDRRRTNLAVAVAADLRAQNLGLTGKEFLDKVSEEVDATLGGGQARNGVDKVESGRGSGGGGASGGKSYADLPPEAKAACEKQAQRLVGTGRAFKTADEWRKHYTNKYFEE